MEKPKEKFEDRLVRILSTDIEGKMQIYAGLTKIKGISWAVANAVCLKLGLDKKKKVGSLTEGELKKLSEFFKNMSLPFHLYNRKKDPTTGEDKHLIVSGLELQKDFDIKRLKKIKSYRGIRHAAGLPVRGQKTRSHFRKNKMKAGIKKRKKEDTKK